MEERLRRLIDACARGEATPQDRRELRELLSRGEYRPLAERLLLRVFMEQGEDATSAEDGLVSAEDGSALSEDTRAAMLEAIFASTVSASASGSVSASARDASPDAVPLRRISGNRLMKRRVAAVAAIAASVVLLVAVGLYLYVNHGFMGADPAAVWTADIAPGGTKAMLTLGDGRTILLDEGQTGIVVDSAIRYADGSLVAAWLENELRGEPLKVTTPRGGHYFIVLPDGSKVWLNAASSLTYPQAFAEGHREVELDGEAYFEIAHRPDQPFRVKSTGQFVDVLGTHFNVQAYADEGAVRTTLVEGRVKVTGLGMTDPTYLNPGEQAIVVGSDIRKERVDLRNAVAWRDGRFDFNGKNLEQVMRELARWYDIEVSFEGPIPSIEFWGGVYRNENLGTVLHILETNELGYRLEGERHLVIFPDEKEGKKR